MDDAPAPAPHPSHQTRGGRLQADDAAAAKLVSEKLAERLTGQESLTSQLSSQTVEPVKELSTKVEELSHTLAGQQETLSELGVKANDTTAVLQALSHAEPWRRYFVSGEYAFDLQPESKFA